MRTVDFNGESLKDGDSVKWIEDKIALCCATN